MMNENILVIGVGEVGESLLKVYRDVDKEDVILYFKDAVKKSSNGLNIDTVEQSIPIDYMHICMPYTRDFIQTTIDYINQYKPIATIIHSTVDVGTTRKIARETNSRIVHSPIMGVHPNLAKGIKTFNKIIGGLDDETTEYVASHFNNIGIDSVIYDTPEDSEAAKLFSTTYYGINILFMKSVFKFCRKHNLNFDEVYTRTNKIYNTGYTELGMTNVVRPILKYVEGPIGGHCIISNFTILKNKFYPAKIAIEMDKETEYAI